MMQQDVKLIIGYLCACDSDIGGMTGIVATILSYFRLLQYYSYLRCQDLF